MKWVPKGRHARARASTHHNNDNNDGDDENVGRVVFNRGLDLGVTALQLRARVFLARFHVCLLCATAGRYDKAVLLQIRILCPIRDACYTTTFEL